MMFTVIFDLKFKGKEEKRSAIYTFHCIADNAYEAAKKCIEIESNEYTECRVLAVNLVNGKEYKEAICTDEGWQEYSKKENEFLNSIISSYNSYEKK